MLAAHPKVAEHFLQQSIFFIVCRRAGDILYILKLICARTLKRQCIQLVDLPVPTVFTPVHGMLPC
jgi:hypothetical protein